MGLISGRSAEAGALVAIDTVKTAADVPSSVSADGEIEQVADEGAPPQVKETVWLKPATGETVREYVAVAPAVTVALVEELAAVAIVKSGAATPVPARVIASGTTDALSVIVRVPVRAPAAVGKNVTLMWHAAPALSSAGQSLVSEKSPFALMFSTSSGAEPGFVRVMVCAALLEPTS